VAGWNAGTCCWGVGLSCSGSEAAGCTADFPVVQVSLGRHQACQCCRQGMPLAGGWQAVYLAVCGSEGGGQLLSRWLCRLGCQVQLLHSREQHGWQSPVGFADGSVICWHSVISGQGTARLSSGYMHPKATKPSAAWQLLAAQQSVLVPLKGHACAVSHGGKRAAGVSTAGQLRTGR